MRIFAAKMGENGGIILPNEVMEMLELQPDDTIIFEIEDDLIRFAPLKLQAHRYLDVVSSLNVRFTNKELIAIARDEHVREWIRKDKEQQEEWERENQGQQRDRDKSTP